MQSPLKGQIPSVHPAKEHVKEAVVENRLPQLFLLEVKSVGAVYALTHFYHSREETLEVKAHL